MPGEKSCSKRAARCAAPSPAISRNDCVLHCQHRGCPRIWGNAAHYSLSSASSQGNQRSLECCIIIEVSALWPLGCVIPVKFPIKRLMLVSGMAICVNAIRVASLFTSIQLGIRWDAAGVTAATGSAQAFLPFTLTSQMAWKEQVGHQKSFFFSRWRKHLQSDFDNIE